MKILTHMIWIMLLSTLASPSFAHVKWFVEFDITDAPQSFSNLLSPLFIILLLLSIMGVFIGSYIDTVWTKKARFSFMPMLRTEYKDLPLSIIRIGTGVFFIMLWLMGGTILTPELVTDNTYIASIQLFLAFTILFRSTLMLTGLGILGLYGYAIFIYGLFHTLDYAFFIGLGIFFILTAWNHAKFNRYRLIIIYVLIGFSFMWSAMEKIAYPQWFDPFFDKYPFVLMGLERPFFIMSAAFVELVLFFMIMRFRNGVALIALAANIMILTGNIYFGKIDALGHLPANVLLLVITIVGNIRRPINKQALSGIVAIRSVGEFLLASVSILLLYYFIHWAQYE